MCPLSGGSERGPPAVRLLSSPAEFSPRPMSAENQVQASGGLAPPTTERKNPLLTLLMVPCVGSLLVWMIVPLALTIIFSFIRFNLLKPEVSGFAGFENYSYLWSDESFFPAIINTIVLMGSVLIITVVLGTLLAVLYDREFFGKNVATLLVIAPFFVMPTVSVLIWKNMIMDPVNGLIAQGCKALGLAPDRLVRQLSDALDNHHRFMGVAAVRVPDPLHGPEVAGHGTERGGVDRRCWSTPDVLFHCGSSSEKGDRGGGQ